MKIFERITKRPALLNYYLRRSFYWPDTLPEVAALLEQNDTVTQIYRVTGKSKLHVHAVASSSEEMEELMYDSAARVSMPRNT